MARFIPMTDEVEAFEAQITSIEDPTAEDAAVAAEVIQNVIEDYAEVQSDAKEMETAVERVLARADLKCFRLQSEGRSERAIFLAQSEGISDAIKKAIEWVKKIFRAIVDFFKSLFGKFRLNMKKFKVQVQDIETIITEATKKKIVGEINVEFPDTSYDLVVASAITLASPYFWKYTLSLGDLKGFSTAFNNFVKVITADGFDSNATAELKISSYDKNNNESDMPLQEWITARVNAGFNPIETGKENINKFQNILAKIGVEKTIDLIKTAYKDYSGSRLLLTDPSQTSKPLKERIKGTDGNKDGYMGVDILKKFKKGEELTENPTIMRLPVAIAMIDVAAYEKCLDVFKEKMEESLKDAEDAAKVIDNLKDNSDSSKSARSAAASKVAVDTSNMTKIVSFFNAALSSSMLLSMDLMAIGINEAEKVAKKLETLMKDKGETGEIIPSTTYTSLKAALRSTNSVTVIGAYSISGDLKY